MFTHRPTEMNPNSDQIQENSGFEDQAEIIDEEESNSIRFDHQQTYPTKKTSKQAVLIPTTTITELDIPDAAKYRSHDLSGGASGKQSGKIKRMIKNGRKLNFKGGRY